MRLALVALALTGCASSTQIYTPSGEQGQALNCSGLARSWNDCLSRAGDLCGAKGYAVVERNGELVATAAATSTGALGAQSTTRTMLVVCKP